MGWTEAKCEVMVALAQEDHTYMDTREELESPLALRHGQAAVSLNNHLYRHSEDYQRPVPLQDHDRQKTAVSIFIHTVKA